MSNLLEFLFEVFCGGTKLGSFSFKFLQFPLALNFILITSFLFPALFKAVKNNAYNLLQSDSRFSFCCPFAAKSTETIILSSWFSLSDGQLTVLCLRFTQIVCRLLLHENETIFALKVLITDYFSSLSLYYFSNYLCYKIEYLRSSLSERFTITFHLSKFILDVAFFFLYLLEHLFMKN